MSRILKLQCSLVLGVLLTFGAGSTARSDDDHGHGGHGGHGGNNHSQNFFGLGPEGFTYGYRNDNFGLLIGPVGGRQAEPYYAAPMYDPGYAAPMYDPGIVQGYPGGYADPAVNGNGGWSEPATPSTSPTIAAPAPASGTTQYSGTPGSLAETFYRKSVDAFRNGEYDQATRLADHAIVEDSDSGFLRVYAAQCLLATGEFDASAAALNDGLQRLPQIEWGKEIKNFRDLYKRNDYVTHIKQLEKFAAENPKSPIGNALCAYHFYYLGHSEAALRHWQAANEADPNNELVQRLGATIGQPRAETLPPPASVLDPSK